MVKKMVRFYRRNGLILEETEIVAIVSYTCSAGVRLTGHCNAHSCYERSVFSTLEFYKHSDGMKLQCVFKFVQHPLYHQGEAHLQ